MVRSLEQILKDLDSLTAATNKIDQDLKDVYRQYLEVLGKSVKRQLVLAVYHLCTQVYPEAFLKLSVSQRERVQEGIRKIADQGRGQIEQLGRAVATKSSIAANSNDASSEDQHTLDGQSLQETEESMSVPTDAVGNQMPEISDIRKRLSSVFSLFADLEAETTSPINLAKRHVLLEKQLRGILQTVSSLTNYLLKQAQVLPDLPEMVIAAAAEAESRESGQTTPNLLNVLVEMSSDRTQDDSDQDEDSEENASLEEEESEGKMTHLVAVHLRLADIEFADTHTALWRGKLQEALARLKRLGNQYQKLQREKAKAEAEYAWRATWFEE